MKISISLQMTRDEFDLINEKSLETITKLHPEHAELFKMFYNDLEKFFPDFKYRISMQNNIWGYIAFKAKLKSTYSVALEIDQDFEGFVIFIEKYYALIQKFLPTFLEVTKLFKFGQIFKDIGELCGETTSVSMKRSECLPK